MKSIQQNRWILDTALFAGFLFCFYLDFTGVSLHQWLGVAGGAVAAYHLISHSKWVSAVTHRFFGKTSNQARLYYLIDAILLAGFVTILTTGLVISTWLNLSLANYTGWWTVHIAASIVTLVAVTVKIALHSRWILSGARKIFGSQAVDKATTPQLHTETQAVATSAYSRREFLRMMGLVGGASLIALSSATQTLLAQAEAKNHTALEISTGNGIPSDLQNYGSQTFSNSGQNESGTCRVRCNRRCAYPGHCRRYQDSNSSGRCDLGECQV